MDELSHCTPNLESLFISINNTETPVIIGVVYRPPTGDVKLFSSEINSLLEKIPSSNVYLTGDFNIDLLKSNVCEYEEIIYGNGFSPLISIATHFKPGCKPSCIDNILSNSTDNVTKSGVIDTAASHHTPIFCIIENPCKIHEDEPVPPRYDYSESNLSKFEHLLQMYSNDNIHTHTHRRAVCGATAHSKR